MVTSDDKEELDQKNKEDNVVDRNMMLWSDVSSSKYDSSGSNSYP